MGLALPKVAQSADCDLINAANVLHKIMAEDDRGFTTAGIGHVPPEFNPPSPAAAGKKTRSSSKLRPFPIIQVPLSSSSVSPEDLDLDSTIKAGQSFGSSSGSQDREAGLQESSSHYENSTYGDNTTSYAMAVNRGRFDSVAMGYGGSQLVGTAAIRLLQCCRCM